MCVHHILRLLPWTYRLRLVVLRCLDYQKWRPVQEMGIPNLKTNVLQLVVPRHRVKEILVEAHDSSIGGHFGVNKTLEKIRKRFYWVMCKQDIEN